MFISPFLLQVLYTEKEMQTERATESKPEGQYQHTQTHAVYHHLSYLLRKRGCCNSATSLQCLKQSCCPLRTGTV